MSTTSSTLFNGTSRYSSDFQQIIDRGVAIASLHLTQLSTQKTALEAESSALADLDAKFTSVNAAITSLQNATGLSSYTANVSNGGIVAASVSSGAMVGTYTIEVTGLGSQTSTMSKDGLTAVTDPSTQNISSASSFTLTIGGNPTVITPAANTLTGLVTAINDAGLDVQASIVNIGTNDAPDYRLSILSTKYDNVSIQLNDGAADLMDLLAAGAKASYKLNGMATAIQNDSRTVTLAPGVTLTLVGQSDPGVAATVTVSRSTAAVSNALTSLVNAYNAAMDALDAHRGQAGGALTGNSLVLTLAGALRDLAQYSAGSGTIASLTDLGLTFDDQGTLSFDTAAFSTATSGQVDELLDFLGSSTGTGFLKSASDILDSLEDETDGVIKAAISSQADAIEAQSDLIAAEQDRVDLYEEQLIRQMSAADALIAALEQKAIYMSALFESMRIASEMYAY